MARVFQGKENTNLDPAFFQFESGESVLKQRTIESVQRNDLIWSNDNQDYSDIPLSNPQNTINYSCSALKGIQETSLFSDLFFSPRNIKELQRLIRYNVHKELNYVISEQSETELVIIMRSTYLTYSRVPKDTKDIKSALEKLNKLVILQIMPDLISNVQQYLGHIKYLNTADVLDRSINVSVSGTKSLRSITDVLIGDDVFFNNTQQN